MKNLKKNLKDIKTIFSLRMKIILKNKFVLISLIITLFVSVISINTLIKDGSKKSSIPIGIVNNDNTIYSKEFIKKLEEKETFNVIKGTKRNLKRKLKKKEIQHIFIIEERLEEKIILGDNDNLITVISPNNSKEAPILSDILAGELIEDICLYKGYNMYKKTVPKENKADKEEYLSYANSLTKDDKLKYRFDLEIVSTKSNNLLTTTLENSLIYKQITIGILGMLLSLIMLFSVQIIVDEKHHSIGKRMTVMPVRNVSRILGDILALNAIGIIITFILGTVLVSALKIKDFLKIIQIFALLFAFIIVICFLLVVLSQFNLKGSSYQLIGSFLILFCGFIGFLSFIVAYLPNQFLNLIKFVPNYWLIDGITDIMLK